MKNSKTPRKKRGVVFYTDFSFSAFVSNLFFAFFGRGFGTVGIGGFGAVVMVA